MNKFSVSATLVLTVEETLTAHTVTFDPNGGTLSLSLIHILSALFAILVPETPQVLHLNDTSNRTVRGLVSDVSQDRKHVA